MVMHDSMVFFWLFLFFVRGFLLGLSGENSISLKKLIHHSIGVKLMFALWKVLEKKKRFNFFLMFGYHNNI